MTIDLSFVSTTGQGSITPLIKLTFFPGNLKTTYYWCLVSQ